MTCVLGGTVAEVDGEQFIGLIRYMIITKSDLKKKKKKEEEESPVGSGD